MKRLFLSLYGLLLLSLLLLGYGLDQLWQHFNTKAADATASQRQLVQLLAGELQERPPEQWQPYLDSHDIKAQLIAQADLSLAAPLKEGQILPLTQGNQDFLLAPIDGSYLLLGPFEQRPDDNSYGFAALFFILLGLLVLLWLWPLARELRALKQAAQAVGKGYWQRRLTVRRGDYLADLAQSFNLMAQRIESLLADQALMTRAVSHDLRTPLARLRFALAMNGKGPYDQSIKEELDYLEQIINHWSQFHELETVDSISKEAITLRPFLAKVVGTTPLSFIEPLPQTLLADPHLLTRCLQNLLENAKRYASNQICLGWSQGCLFVEDDGPGLSEEDKARATQLFYRGDSARSQDESPRLGLGLAMCARIMHLHGGELLLGDSPLGGARISLRFPVP